MQHITIKKLGPVDFFSMDIKQYNFFIGDQATGKSTIAKAIYFCRNYKSVLKEALNDIYDNGTYMGIRIDTPKRLIRKIRNEVKSQFINFFGYSWDLDQEMSIQYDFILNKIWIKVDIKRTKYAKTSRQYINLIYSKVLSEKINNVINEVMELYKNKDVDTDTLNLNSKEHRRVRSSISEKVNEIFDDYEETYYIPAGRSMLALLSKGDLSLMGNSLDYVTCHFITLINSIRNNFVNGIYRILDFVDDESKRVYSSAAQLIIDILKADYYVSPDKEYISIESKSRKSRIPLNFASSGQQECLWLLNLLYILLLRKEKGFIIIEEPEAHMYPTQQYKILKFISYFSNETGSNVLITTHSPYFLNALNTLYIAGSSIIRNNAELKKKVEGVVGGNYFVEENSLQAYKIQLLNSESLLDMNEGELKTEMIDEVSNEIIADYMKIYNLISEIREKEDE